MHLRARSQDVLSSTFHRWVEAIRSILAQGVSVNTSWQRVGIVALDVLVDDGGVVLGVMLLSGHVVPDLGQAAVLVYALDATDI